MMKRNRLGFFLRTVLQANGWRYRLASAAIILAVVILAAVLWTAARRDLPPPPAGVEVAVLVVKPRSVVLTTELPGRTSPYRVAEVRPQVSGLIQKRLFVEGSDVKAGALLYQIDPAPFQAALDNALGALGRAEANLLPARARAERLKELLNDKSVSQQDYDDAQGAWRQAEADVKFWKAAVDTARINLAYARITSPISGRIGRSSVTEGAVVTAYQPVPLAVVQELHPIYVDVTQATGELLRLQKQLEQGRLVRNGASQNTARLILEDGSIYPWEGTVQFQDISVDPTTGTVVLRTIFPNPQGVLLPGMFVRALIEEGVNENAILIPQQAVLRDPKGNPLVMIVGADGRAEVRPVTLQRAIGAEWLVAAGLAAGERVIVEGLFRVRPGVPVVQVPWVTSEKQPESEKAPQRELKPN